MLAEDMAGRPYNKAQHRRSLMPLLRSRTEDLIDFKHQNISAVLKGLGENWIPGYKPAYNFQPENRREVAQACDGRGFEDRAEGTSFTRYDRCGELFLSAICIATTVMFWL